MWKLEEDVKNYNFEWTITDKSISNKFYNEEQKIILSFSFSRFYKFLKENDILKFNSNKLIEIIKDYDEKNNGSGLLFVSSISDNTGNNWRYKDFKNNSWIYAPTLNELEEIVENNGLKWEIINERLFENSLNKDKTLINKLNNEVLIQKKNTKTGFFRVSFNKCWEYNYSNNSGEPFKIKKRTISQLKDSVLNLNLPWIILNPELAKNSEIKDNELIKKHNIDLELKKINEENERMTELKKVKEVGSEKPEVKRKELYKMFR